jgi:LysM repeat protein
LRRAAENLKPGFGRWLRVRSLPQPAIAADGRFVYLPAMRFWIRFAFCLLAALLGAALGGCVPGQGQTDEEKEPHFVLGQGRVNAMDYSGAVDAFEESLEANPRSAAAHYQLAILYEEKVPDPAAAIYHYRRYLKLNPNAGNATLIRQRIDACKRQLAADVMGLPSTSAAQQQLEKLVGQNRDLQQQADRLQETVKQWNAYYASQLAARSNAPPQNNSIAPPNPGPTIDDISAQPTTTPGLAQSKPAPPKPARPRTHTVASGETAAGIARKFGVKLSALQAANPGMNPARIRAGQVLNLPPP